MGDICSRLVSEVEFSCGCEDDYELVHDDLPGDCNHGCVL